MRPVLKRKLVSVIFAGLALCTGLGVYFAWRGSAQVAPLPPTVSVNVPQAEVLPKTVNAGLPARLKIPKINVDAALEYVGLTAKGRDLAAPKAPANAAWYDQGPRPGDSGNAVIDGHYGYKDHKPAVFDNLYTLQPGDSIYVEDKQGVTTTFVVRETRSFGPNQDATVVFRPADGKAHLNLITCQGAWSNAQQSYAARLVVFADKQQALPPQAAR